MPEPFKNLFSKKLIRGMADHFARVWPEFDQQAYIAAAGKNLKSLELKERSVQITAAMRAYLPEDFPQAARILQAGLAPAPDCDVNGDIDDRGIVGWAILPMAHYVGLYGIEHAGLSLPLLREMTIRSSSEFGIRFFLLDEPIRTLSVLETWARDPNQHVRRLVSEGTRPRLPWAMQLPEFIKEPAPVIRLLEILKDDPEEYVRRSVANNLNDIAKDHPDLVARIARKWMKGAGKDRKRLIRHACRTLIKQGHAGALKALGYDAPRVKMKELKILTPRVPFGSALEFQMQFTSESDSDQPLIVDYAIHHRKANGSTTPKVFKWKSITIGPRATQAAIRKHSMKKITTRVYYPGKHSLEIIINGESMGSKNFELIM